MNLQKCTIEFLPQAIVFYDEVVQYLEQHINYPNWTYQQYPCAETVTEAAENGNQYLCMEDGEILGGFVLDEELLSDAHTDAKWAMPLSKGKYLAVHALAVKPEQQGKGIGRFLAESCIRLAKEGGYAAIRMDVIVENTPAIALYEACGFHRTGVETYLQEGEKLLHLCFLEYLLPASAEATNEKRSETI